LIISSRRSLRRGGIALVGEDGAAGAFAAGFVARALALGFTPVAPAALTVLVALSDVPDRSSFAISAQNSR